MHNHKTLAERVEISSTEHLTGSPCVLAVPREKTEIEHSPAETSAEGNTEKKQCEAAELLFEPTIQESKCAYLPPNFNTIWPASRTNQIINVVYFGASAAFFHWVSNNHHGLVPPALTYGLLFLVALSGLFLVKYRTFVSTDDELPLRLQKFLRSSALTLPALALCSIVYMFHATLPPPELDHYFPAGTIKPVMSAEQTALAEYQNECVLGELFLADYNYIDAQTHFDRARAIYPTRERALVGLMKSWYGLDTTVKDKVIEYGNLVAEVNPNSFDAHFYLADSYNNNGQFHSAVPHAKFLTVARPNYGRGWALLCTAELGAKHLDAALQAANEHIRLHPKEWDAVNDRVTVFLVMGRTKEAEAERKRNEANLERVRPL